jgi:hypothetical protein
MGVSLTKYRRQIDVPAKPAKPIDRALELLREMGYSALKVEGLAFANILALRHGEILAIRLANEKSFADQVTATVMASEVAAWLGAGGRLEIWAFSRGEHNYIRPQRQAIDWTDLQLRHVAKNHPRGENDD